MKVKALFRFFNNHKDPVNAGEAGDLLKHLRPVKMDRNIKFGPFINDSVQNLCSLQHFKKRLLLERRRSERLDTISSIILMDFQLFIGNDGTSKRALEQLLKMIGAMIRETDVVSVNDKDMILVLLPDTDTRGAQNVCDKMMKRIKLAQSKNPILEKINFDKTDINILLFPEKVVSRTTPVTAALAMAESDTRIPNNGFKLGILKNIYFKTDYLNHLEEPLFLNGSASLSVPLVKNSFLNVRVWTKLSLFFQRLIKRAFDLSGALFGLLILSPVFFITAILVKVTSKGPILYQQKRLGHKGRYFTFYKFRSMYVNNEDRIHREYMKKLISGSIKDINNGSDNAPCYKIVNDPRITPFGKLMRKTSIDELPQLWNVLIGEMSLVGPRPPLPYEVEEYKNWHYRRVFDVKPGITGLWQVSGRNKTTFDEMVRLDIFYAKNWSLVMDLNILIKTAKSIFVADGL